VTTRAELVQACRRWLGTPYHHQASLRGVGCDCIGLLTGAAADVGLVAAGVPDRYSRGPEADLLLAAVNGSDQLRAVPVPEARPGDILLFRVRHAPRHFGLMTSPRTFIHADSYSGTVEIPYSERWRAHALAAYTITELVD
jgi:NlpC/P60 family putative phage cell wall peptidase